MFDKDLKFSLGIRYSLWDISVKGSIMNDVFPDPSHFNFINIDSGSKNNKLRGTLPLTMIGEGKVPHLALWQRAMALSALMNYIDTQAILMTLPIYPSPLSFLSLFPALGLAPASSHCSNIQS